MSRKITPDAIEKVANGNVLFYSRGLQTKMIQGDATVLKTDNPYGIKIIHQNDEFDIGIGKLATMTLRGVATTLTPPTANKSAQYQASVDTIFDEFSKNYFAGGGDVVAISDIGENSASIVISSWTVDPIDSDYYYFDFAHNLGSNHLFWEFVDLDTNKVVIPHEIEYIDSVTSRITVYGNTYRLRVSVNSGLTGVVGVVGGNPARTYRASDVSTTAILGEVLEVDTTIAERTVVLPSPSEVGFIDIGNEGVNRLVIDPNGESVNGSTAVFYLTSQYDTITLFFNGTQYRIK